MVLGWVSPGVLSSHQLDCVSWNLTCGCRTYSQDSAHTWLAVNADCLGSPLPGLQFWGSSPAG